MFWHTISLEEVQKELQTDFKRGLSLPEARRRRRKFGLNTVEVKEKTTVWQIFLNQFKNPLVYVLFLVAAAAFAIGHRTDAVFIIVVLILDAAVGFIQELKAEKAVAALGKITTAKARVMRGGEIYEILDSELIPGDIVLLQEGRAVPADLRILESYELTVSEAVLTGESAPVVKKVGELKSDVLLAERFNMAFLGTAVVSGRGAGVVIATGRQTELGKIAQVVAAAQERPSPLQQKFAQLSKYILFSILILAILVFAVSFAQGITLLDTILTSISLAVAAVPEGLPVIVVIVLTVASFRMASRKAVVRKLLATEAMGSVDAFVVDKTGTVTQNIMKVSRICLADQEIEVIGVGYSPQGKFLLLGKEVRESKIEKAIREILSHAVWASNSGIVKKENDFAPEGDPTEAAIAAAAGKAGISQLKSDTDGRLDEIPFSSERQYLAVLHQKNKYFLISVKGSPEQLLERSKFILRGGKLVYLSPTLRKKINLQIHKLASQALRTLAVAYKKTSEKKFDEDDINDLIFLGVLAIEDPLRPEAARSLEQARDLGIDVYLVTGDHPQTALAVAGQIGLAATDKDIALGSDFEKPDFNPLSYRVFARVTPEQKFQLVKLLQKQGLQVGVTGDGVNDGPALKQADVGVAMGRGGTEVARQTADIVLLDDNFQTIVSAVEEGRTVFSNIRKVIFFLLSTNLSEILVILVSLLIGLPLPFLPAQILWINLITDSTADDALAFEPPYGLRPEPVKKIIEPLIVRRIMVGAIAMTAMVIFIYFFSLKYQDTETARTSAFLTLIFLQLFNVLNSRSLYYSVSQVPFFSNKWIFATIGISLALSLIAVYLPFFQNLFNLKMVSLMQVFSIAAFSSAVILVIEIDKLMTKKTKQHFDPEINSG